MFTVGLIFRRELLELWRTRQLPAAFIGCALLFGVIMAIGIAAHNDHETKRAAYERVNWEEWIGQEGKGPHGAAHFGQYAFKQELPVAALDPGIRDVRGAAVILETHRRGDWRFPVVNDASPAARIARASMADLLQLIGPLIIFLAGFRIYAAERERGTLAWVAATSANPAAIMAGKALAVCVASAALLLPFMACAFWLVFADATAHQGLVRLGLMAGVYVIYFLTFVAVTLGVSARARTSANAMALLLLIWVAVCIAAPRAGVLAAEAIAPTPAQAAFAASLRHDLERTEDGGYWADRRRAQLLKETLDEYGVDTIDELPVGYSGIMIADSEKHTSDVYSEHYRQLEERHDRQDAARLLISGLLGPQTAIGAMSSEFAASNTRAYRYFEHAAEAYRADLNARLNQVIIDQGSKDGWDVKLDRDFLEQTPRFSPGHPPPSIFKGVNFPAIVILGAWLIAALIFAYRSALTLRARSTQ